MGLGRKDIQGEGNLRWGQAGGRRRLLASPRPAPGFAHSPCCALARVGADAGSGVGGGPPILNPTPRFRIFRIGLESDPPDLESDLEYLEYLESAGE